MHLERNLLGCRAMIIRILFYLFFLLLFFFLPESFWEKAWHFVQSFFDKLKNTPVLGKFSRERLPLVGEFHRGEKLLNFIPLLEARLGQGQKNGHLDLPRFKFYTHLLTDLLELHRKLGASLKHILPELRINLAKELRFEKKILGQLAGGNLQFSVVTVTTWSFILLSSELAGLELHAVSLGLIAFVQIAAFCLFNLLFLRLRNHGLLKFSRALEELYLFNALVEIGRPVNQVLTETNILGGELFKHTPFRAVAERLFNLVNRWKNDGLSPRAETQEIVVEIWHAKEQGYERFLKHLDLLKFSILAFFFLPAYFFYLYSIFQFFMEQ